MKILLDENLHNKLKFRFPDHEVTTVRDMGWSGKRNGELMKLMIDYEFELLVTLDKGFDHQHNFNKYPIPVLVLKVKRSDYEYLLPLVSKIKAVLDSELSQGVTVILPD
ncbi:DUF5615 family PIN-like protein [Spirosoma endophyticum]|uniref:DUF5615 domain-containing protein n=1 Tax=Spirosoma endophyticum TaxID=662367 RepID=A0A1I2F2K6_9BACT|nr:DUF5615 family PIN-like protein [Spirosoma endophyticum]SFE98761.1 hypothetical protein SAMN05216167_1249 [Spirosoma endophyticum]